MKYIFSWGCVSGHAKVMLIYAMCPELLPPAELLAGVSFIIQGKSS